MTSLGDLFPKGFENAFAVNRELKVGDVLYLYCDFTNSPKFKYLVVCCCNPLLVLVINSEINDFIRLRDSLLACQVDIPQADHAFLDWDSYINCVEAQEAFDLEVVKEQLTQNYREVLRGEIADYSMREVYLAVERSEIMLKKHKKLILAALVGYSS